MGKDMRLFWAAWRVYIVMAAFIAPAFSMAQDSGAILTPAITKHPTLIEGPQSFPEDALAEGHNGTVFVSVILTEAGQVEGPSIRRSSGSALLDSAALQDVKNWKLTPALDSSGNAVRVPITLSLEYTKAFDGKYKCSQFAADSDWFDRVRGRDKREELRIYKTLRGFPVVAAINSGKTASLQSFDFDENWDRLIKFCRENPGKNFRESWRKLL